MNEIMPHVWNILIILFTLFIPFVYLQIRKFVHKATEHFDAKTANEIDNLVTSIVAQAACAVESMARKQSENSGPVDSSSKLLMAVEMIFKQLHDNNINNFSESEIVNKVESYLLLSGVSDTTPAFPFFQQKDGEDEDKE